MPPESAPPPQAVLFNAITGIWVAQALGAVARLGVADHLAHGPRTAAELAVAVKADPAALYRLLRGVASVGMLAMGDDGRFSLTPVTECLRTSVPGSMRSMVIAQTAPGHWLPWGQLEHAVRTGKPSDERALGMGYWDYLRKNPEEEQHFAGAMSGLSTMELQAVLAAYSFEGARKVVDVGGSHGAFLAAVLQREPGARGVLFDQARVIESAGATLEAAKVADRVERIAGDFFESVPAGGDVYLLKHILHDWSDDECVTILRNVREAMAPDGRVVVVEMPIVTDRPTPAPLLDLNMMVMTTGKERTPDEYAALFAKAGLRASAVVPTQAPAAVLEARRV